MMNDFYESYKMTIKLTFRKNRLSEDLLASVRRMKQFFETVPHWLCSLLDQLENVRFSSVNSLDPVQPMNNIFLFVSKSFCSVCDRSLKLFAVIFFRIFDFVFATPCLCNVRLFSVVL